MKKNTGSHDKPEIKKKCLTRIKKEFIILWSVLYSFILPSLRVQVSACTRTGVYLIPTARLIRLEENFQHGTFGILLIQAQVFCVTLEPADLQNLQNKSSIPAQQYTCNRYSSSKYPDTFQIMNVPERNCILFHSGNINEHTRGCIILGQYFGKLKNNRAVLNSGKTFDTFMKIMNNVDKFHLTIVENY